MQWKPEDHGKAVLKLPETSKAASKQLTHNSISKENILPKEKQRHSKINEMCQQFCFMRSAKGGSKECLQN